jgi:hypothetical protein
MIVKSPLVSRFQFLLVLSLTLFNVNDAWAEEDTLKIAVVVSDKTTPLEQAAVEDLIRCLGQLYPSEKFFIGHELPESGKCIVAGCLKSDPNVRRLATADALKAPESFLVSKVSDGGRQIGLIAGPDPRGTAHGVYALLKRLGYGFLLTGDVAPLPLKKAFSFDAWQLADAPLVAHRLVYQWHNFLSGCSTWNLPEWKQWIDQSQKMGFNGVMVHAYGNNPMAAFEFEGRQKPVGYLSTTVKGRDWATSHVNDARLLAGGFAFDGPVFGAQAAFVPDDRRVDSARKLMGEVFAAARQRGMDVYFAVDVDTIPANPPKLIEPLPESARIRSADHWLPNPDTPEGYGYYKAQVLDLLRAYPQITHLVPWFRHDKTPLMMLTPADMPPEWQKEYAAEVAKNPKAKKMWKSPSMFALSKIVRALERALKEAGRDKVCVGVGSWQFDWFPAADCFLPPRVPLIALDSEVLKRRAQLRDERSRRIVRETGAHRPVVPIVWPQHDDGDYIGRPYIPYSEFYTRLLDAKADGFGIVHWTTRPLDLFFISLANQTWRSTRDQPLRETCREMALQCFGPSAAEPMGRYLEQWITTAPMFGRDTGNRFISRQVAGIPKKIAGCQERLKIIESVDAARLTPDQRDRLNYFKGLEEFIVAFMQTQNAYQESRHFLREGKLGDARQAIDNGHPASVINQFARFSSIGGITRGEQGLVVSLNMHWLTHFMALQQALALEPVCCKFGPTSQDPLAQGASPYTYYIDAGRNWWEVFGDQETGAKAFSLPSEVKITRDSAMSPGCEEICRTGIESDKLIRLLVRPIMGREDRYQPPPLMLSAGRYRLSMLFLDPHSTAPGQRVFDVSIRAGKTPADKSDRIDVFKETGQANRILHRDYTITLDKPGEVEVLLQPVVGNAILSGIVLEPIPENAGAEGLPN